MWVPIRPSRSNTRMVSVATRTFWKLSSSRSLAHTTCLPALDNKGAETIFSISIEENRFAG